MTAALRRMENGPKPDVGSIRPGLTLNRMRVDWRAAMQSIEWRPIVGYEGRYEVSEFGQVRSIRGNIIRGAIDKAGYRRVGLYKDGKTRTEKVHRLVAFAFVDRSPGERLEVCHNDGDSLNNDWRNLRWDTRSANMLDRSKHGRAYRGGRPKLGESQKAEIVRRRIGGESSRVLAAEFDVHIGTVERLYPTNGRRLVCTKGHLLSPENVMTEVTGARRCVTCRRASWNAREKRRRHPETIEAHDDEGATV